MSELPCTCDQHGDYCFEHPNCACGCPKHAHDSTGCVAGSMNCHGCVTYRPAQLKRFHELNDDQLEQVTLEGLREEYKAFRAHHIEEASALLHCLTVAGAAPKLTPKRNPDQPCCLASTWPGGQHALDCIVRQSRKP